MNAVAFTISWASCAVHEPPPRERIGHGVKTAVREFMAGYGRKVD
jgi:hypothetical protein